MRIIMIVEGDTERAFKTALLQFLGNRLAGRMPSLKFEKCDGPIPIGDQLQRRVAWSLNDRKEPADHVIVLTDVYTGGKPPKFTDAADAKEKMRRWVGDDPRFHPHAAQYDFEAWLLPYWATIQRLAESEQSAPQGRPEDVNHDQPPAHRIEAVFNQGSRPRKYVKPRDAGRILRDNDLSVAIDQCPELKALVNTILTLCDAPPIP